MVNFSNPVSPKFRSGSLKQPNSATMGVVIEKLSNSQSSSPRSSRKNTPSSSGSEDDSNGSYASKKSLKGLLRQDKSSTCSLSFVSSLGSAEGSSVSEMEESVPDCTGNTVQSHLDDLEVVSPPEQQVQVPQ